MASIIEINGVEHLVDLEVVQEFERLQSLTQWVPFDEQRPPADESRYKAIHKNGKSWWCWIPEHPEGVK